MMKIEDLAVGDSLPERKHEPSNVSLFLYNAAVWNAHRIHYDERYTREEEGHTLTLWSTGRCKEIGWHSV